MESGSVLCTVVIELYVMGQHTELADWCSQQQTLRQDKIHNCLVHAPNDWFVPKLRISNQGLNEEHELDPAQSLLCIADPAKASGLPQGQTWPS